MSRPGPQRAGWRVAAVVILAALPALAAPPAKPAKSARSASKPAKPTSQRPGAPAPQRLGHTVRSGESLWTIARRHGVSVEALSQLNRLQPGQPLRVGRHLAIPRHPASPESQEPASLAEITLGRPPGTGGVVFAWPVSGEVNSPFGPRRLGWHGGIDIAAERGTPVRAAAPGLVVMSGWEARYGRVVKIWHVEGLMTVYAHNHENYVRVGDWVERGQILGTVGATGRATAPHVHFEIRLDGKKYDPLFWLPPAGPVGVATSTAPRTDATP
ncbi:MAG TPA: LysM peptidoglycan-binding domain-containing M23 family metallopeptidase [Vicinamibacteria bacterium]|nr:LysM peptidoglycan-binding domain-containing M23 family metallopeptidase [Vicinamibacteria bacterium]